MEPHQTTNWMPGIIAAGSALLAAITFLLVSLRKHTPVAPPNSSEDLETRYQAMILQLKEHAANRHIHSAEAWATEQARLEQAAAAVLREKAGVKHDALKAEARAAKKAARYLQLEAKIRATQAYDIAAAIPLVK